MQVSFQAEVLAGFVLALARSTGWVFVATPFAMRAVPTQVKLAFAVALAGTQAHAVAAGGVPLDLGGFLLAALVQVAIGLALGFLVVVIFSAVRAAGGMIDEFAGFNIAQIYDPYAEASAAPFARLYELVAVTLLFTTNLHLVLVRGFLRSFEAVKGLHPGDLIDMLTRHVDSLLVSALEIAGPVVAVLFVTEIAFGLLARAAPQMNVFVLAFPVRVVLALGVVMVALPFVVPALGNLVADAVRSMLTQ